ncbi:uncharacterized protein LOC112172890 [Rosa chinensis]|uniref:uncharacterized protein LOC112172890 n=1 Tax=Rosa chinensis TaxID=74649 RepID=UPI000D093C86|nr:uncharacterized protein LOC112172890 [Rosa chinensis]XP_040364943.1 uncharacterized protein LOC112172890 [Rosa chinensis]XP_040364944.1 uncharacterized protein LOC112172890 [Rosa chinensis]XP_040364945.1 uncharacterized protein LOC112172890 [Rosa chinensis]
MEKNRKFKTLLGYLQCSLNSVKERIIQPIEEKPENFPDEQIESLMILVQKGLKLITEKFSKLRRWDLYFCMDDHTVELLGLDSVLRELMEQFWVMELRDVNDIRGYMQYSMSPEVYNLLNENLQRIVDTFEKAWESDTMAPEEPNHEEEEGMEQATLLVFETLFETVHEVLNKKKTPVMFELLLGDIFDRLLLLKPFMEKKAKAFDGTDEELRNFKAKMVKGVEIVRKSSGFGMWGGYNKRKYECINNLLGLNQSLERLLCITRWVEARKARHYLLFLKYLKTASNELKSSYLVQNQTERADGKECEEGLIESSVVVQDQAKRKALAFRMMVETANEIKCSGTSGAESNSRFADLM